MSESVPFRWYIECAKQLIFAQRMNGLRFSDVQKRKRERENGTEASADLLSMRLYEKNGGCLGGLHELNGLAMFQAHIETIFGGCVGQYGD